MIFKEHSLNVSTAKIISFNKKSSAENPLPKIWLEIRRFWGVFSQKCTNLWSFRQRLHGADRIFGRSHIWPLRRTVHTGPANRPQIRSLRRANIRPLRKANFFGTRLVKFANGPVWTALASRIFAQYHKEGVTSDQEAFSKWQIVFNEFSLQASYY